MALPGCRCLLALLFIGIIGCSILHPARAADPSQWRLRMPLESSFFFGKILFQNSTIYIKFDGDHDKCNSSVTYNIIWVLRYCDCYNEISSLEERALKNYLTSPGVMLSGWTGAQANMTISGKNCNELLNPQRYYQEFPVPVIINEGNQELLQKRENGTNKTMPLENPVMNAVMKTWQDGPYIFIVNVTKNIPQDSSSKDAALPNNKDFPFSMIVEVKGPYDYLTLADYPRMIFFMVMCIVYVLFGVLWLAWSACYWRDLLRIQFWVGAVIFLGMLEKAVFYAEFQNIRYHGEPVEGAVILAELLSAVKRSLARILVIIVSLGYGIVKPRLGATLHKVVMAGALYLLFSGMEGVLRVTGAQSDLASLAFIPLAFLDTALCWWIFISLTQTMKLLRLRRNVVKLSLYRHFTNTLILAVVASIVFIVWTTMKFRLVDCQSDWQELWVDDAIWRLLFSMILFVIMILWRPSANNQRFAFSPLTEEDEDDEQKEPMLKESFEGMKMRSSKQETNGNAKVAKAEDDLKWVEENIPSSVTDVALPALLDSDEERMITHFERSKME
ncbi:transmembrane protein 87A [Xenopus laevis]|uniref:Transmembrane protein 87A n=2 Tax=Xenopus laevis TaxID=8355 RepID=A0A1L8FAY3_XENLA|nr:transmembrane protein 87A [Xenopus laevis]OCT68742.1 hypothetical protein XELAEV_18040031mg [Xenopus laevis]